MTSTVYVVSGMNCGGCVARVGRHVGAVAGVRSVAVDLASGRVTVEAEVPDDAGVRAAVAAAGAQVVACAGSAAA